MSRPSLSGGSASGRLLASRRAAAKSLVDAGVELDRAMSLAGSVCFSFRSHGSWMFLDGSLRIFARRVSFASSAARW